MAEGELTLRVSAISLGCLADCTVCGTLVSCKLAVDELDRLSDLRCPSCRGSCVPQEASAFVEVKLEAIP